MPPQLVPINVAAFILSTRPDKVAQMAEAGDLLWVWNLANKTSQRRELRFWVAELQDRESVARLKLDTVTGQLLCNRAQLRLSEVGQLFCLSFQHLAELRNTGTLPARTISAAGPGGRVTWVSSHDLRRLLTSRWLGAPPPASCPRHTCAGQRSRLAA